MMTARQLVRALVPVLGASAALLAPIEMDGHARRALAISVSMVLCWMVDVLHPAIVGFIGCFLFRAIGGVEFDAAFAGFGTATPWFLYGTLLLFAAANRSGLMAAVAVRTPRALACSLPGASLVLIALSYLLSLVVPSSLARGAMLSLIAVAWTRQSAGNGKPAAWLVLVAAYSAAIFGHPEMPGGPGAIVGWDVAAAIALLAGVVWLSGKLPGRGDDMTEVDRVTPGTVNRKHAAPVLLAAGLWVTTPLHQISPELVGLGTGLVSCLPGFVAANRRHAVSPDPLAIIFAGTAISIPVVLVETNAAEAVSHLWLMANQSTAMLPANLVAYWTTTAYRMMSPDGAHVALPSLAIPLGSSAVWAYAGSTMLSLHQSPALILGMSVGGVCARQVLAVGLLVLAAGSIIVMLF